MKWFVSAVLIGIVFSLSAEAQIPTLVTINGRQYYASSHLALLGSGSFASPRRLFSESYNPSYGFSFGVGVVTTPEIRDDIHIASIYLLYSRDMVKLDSKVADRYAINGGEKASISGIYFGFNAGVPLMLSEHFIMSPSFGGGLGGARFSLDEGTFAKMSTSTLSELKSENARSQWSYYSQVGLILSGFNMFSIQYSYDFMNIERAWMVWHSMLSGLISSAMIRELPGLFGNVALSEDARNSLYYQLIVLAYQVGTSIFWYNLNYNHNNWPYHDDPALRYNRQLITLYYHF